MVLGAMQCNQVYNFIVREVYRKIISRFGKVNRHTKVMRFDVVSLGFAGPSERLCLRL